MKTSNYNTNKIHTISVFPLSKKKESNQMYNQTTMRLENKTIHSTIYFQRNHFKSVSSSADPLKAGGLSF